MKKYPIIPTKMEVRGLVDRHKPAFLFLMNPQPVFDERWILTTKHGVEEMLEAPTLSVNDRYRTGDIVWVKEPSISQGGKRLFEYSLSSKEKMDLKFSSAELMPIRNSRLKYCITAVYRIRSDWLSWGCPIVDLVRLGFGMRKVMNMDSYFSPLGTFHRSWEDCVESYLKEKFKEGVLWFNYVETYRMEK